MKADIKQKWIEALRSGEYTQTKGRLRRDETTTRGVFGSEIKAGFCCLGVLCDLAVKDGAVSYYDPMRGYPPASVQRWSGLNSSQTIQHLAYMNDGGKTFNEIADHIEKRFK